MSNIFLQTKVFSFKWLFLWGKSEPILLQGSQWFMSWCCSSHNHLLVAQLFLVRDPRPVRKWLRAPPDPKIAFQPRSAASDQPTSNFLHLLQESNWTPGLLLADKTQRRRLIGRDRGKTTAGWQGRGGRGSTGSLRKGSWRRFVYLTIDTRWLKRSIINLFESIVVRLPKSLWSGFVVHMNSKSGMSTSCRSFFFTELTEAREWI